MSVLIKPTNLDYFYLAKSILDHMKLENILVSFYYVFET